MKIIIIMMKDFSVTIIIEIMKLTFRILIKDSKKTNNYYLFYQINNLYLIL